MSVTLLLHPLGPTRLGDFLKTQLSNDSWTSFRAAVAFVKRSGVQHIEQLLEDFSHRAKVSISAGIDRGGTSREGLASLLDSLKGRGRISIFHNPTNSTFHPKVYVFKNDKRAEVLIGSGNLTQGGLFTNYEAFVALSLELCKEDHRNILSLVEAALDLWSIPNGKTVRPLTGDLLDQLVDHGYVPDEAHARGDEGPDSSQELGPVAVGKRQPLFTPVAVLPPPKVQRKPAGLTGKPPSAPVGPPKEHGYTRAFLMTLQRTDVGKGQVTRGTSQRSPEVFIPLVCRDFDPNFWHWPDAFTEDRKKPGKMDRAGVRMLIGGKVIEVNMMTWPDKRDFRLRHEALRSAGTIGDILRIEKVQGNPRYEYIVEVIRRGDRNYDPTLAKCVQTVRNSDKRWNYT